MPHDLHLLAAVAGDLQFPQPGHLELGPALVAQQEDVEVVHVLHLQGSLGASGAGANDRMEPIPIFQMTQPIPTATRIFRISPMDMAPR